MTVQGRLKRIDTVGGVLLLEEGGQVSLGEILWVELPGPAPGCEQGGGVGLPFHGAGKWLVH